MKLYSQYCPGTDTGIHDAACKPNVTMPCMQVGFLELKGLKSELKKSRLKMFFKTKILNIIVIHFEERILAVSLKRNK